MQACILDESTRIVLMSKNTLDQKKRTTDTKHEWNDAVISFFTFSLLFIVLKQKYLEKKYGFKS